MLRSHLINEKPGDTQATKMLTVCKRTASPTNGVSVSPEGVVQIDRIASIPTDRAPTTTNNPLTAIQQPRVSTTKVSALPSNKVTPGTNGNYNCVSSINHPQQHKILLQ